MKLGFLDRSAHEAAPFGPGAIIVAHLWIAQQISQYKPGMRRTLPNATVSDYRLVWGDILACIELAQLLCGLEGAIGIGRRRPGNILGPWNVPAALRSFLWIVDHVYQFACILLRGAYINEASFEVFQPGCHLVAENSDRFIGRLSMIGRGGEMRHLFGQRALLGFPLAASAVHDLHVAVPIHGKQPERAACIPVIAVLEVVSNPLRLDQYLWMDIACRCTAA